MERVFVSVSDVASSAKTTYPTAKSAIDSLVKFGILVPSARQGGRQIWEAKDLLEKIYET